MVSNFKVISQEMFEKGQIDVNIYSEGLVIIWDKETGCTSHDVVARVRKQITLRSGFKIKIGHAGTLDPLATGLLILLIGKATKVQVDYMGMDKEYVAEMILGYVSDTYDVDGKVVQQQDWDKKFTKIEDVKNLLKEKIKLFVGEISQTVPIYSAVKVRGKKLYQYARSGGEIILPIRKVTISNIEILDVSKVDNLWDEGRVYKIKMRVNCSSGTYIRSLVHDLGQEMGCGGIVCALRRIAIGGYYL